MRASVFWCPIHSVFFSITFSLCDLGGTVSAQVLDAPPSEVRSEDLPLRAVSPITPELAAYWREIRASNERMRDQVFSKVGDSATVNWGFMSCFASDRVELDGREWLRSTVHHFSALGRVFQRRSAAAGVGWSSVALLRGGAKSPLDRELRSARPRFALVMLGTNDLQGPRIDRFTTAMWSIVERLTSRGVIPILSTILPRGDSPERDAWVFRYNAVVRALAQGLRVPWVDLHPELMRLPRLGLAGDGVHPNIYWFRGRSQGCVLDSEGLQYGQNVRNLLNLVQLDRVRRVVLEQSPAPDPSPLPVPGDGSIDRPFEHGELPFSDLAVATSSEEKGVSERLYRFTLATPQRVWFQISGRRSTYAGRRGPRHKIRLFRRDGLDRSAAEPHSIGETETCMSMELEEGTYEVVVHPSPRSDGAYLLTAEPWPDQNSVASTTLSAN
ncbi:MAG: SGNH/GDSL hydrolase family protein [Myxococcota bacterium]